MGRESGSPPPPRELYTSRVRSHASTSALEIVDVLPAERTSSQLRRGANPSTFGSARGVRGARWEARRALTREVAAKDRDRAYARVRPLP